MSELFVPYKIAKKLKSLGFNEPCFAWHGNVNAHGKKRMVIERAFYNGLKDSGGRLDMPLYQQAIHFLENKFNLKIDYNKGENPENYYPVLIDYNIKKEYNWYYKPSHWAQTRQEAILKSIEEAIKLIEQ